MIIRIKAKGKAWNGMESTQDVASIGEAIRLAGAEFSQVHGELAFKAWELVRLQGDVVIVRPTAPWK